MFVRIRAAVSLLLFRIFGSLYLFLRFNGFAVVRFEFSSRNFRNKLLFHFWLNLSKFRSLELRLPNFGLLKLPNFGSLKLRCSGLRLLKLRLSNFWFLEIRTSNLRSLDVRPLTAIECFDFSLIKILLEFVPGVVLKIPLRNRITNRLRFARRDSRLLSYRRNSSFGSQERSSFTIDYDRTLMHGYCRYSSTNDVFQCSSAYRTRIDSNVPVHKDIPRVSCSEIVIPIARREEMISSDEKPQIRTNANICRTEKQGLISCRIISAAETEIEPKSGVIVAELIYRTHIGKVTTRVVVSVRWGRHPANRIRSIRPRHITR